MTAPLLTLRHVGVAIGGAEIVSNVELTVGSGQWLSIIGPNGAGKSTLLKAIAGSLSSTGEILVAGETLRGMRPTQRAARVSWMPQTPTIPGGMSVLDYVLLGRTPHLHPLASPRDSDIELAKGIIERLDLSSLATRDVDTLSGGERQRAVIGRALAQEAPLLLLDEPTSALDLGHQQEVLALLDELRRDGGRAIVSTMHDLTLAGAYADELVMMSKGKIAYRGAADEVLTETNIATHYGASVKVENVDGTILVIPQIPHHEPNQEKS